MRTTVLIKKLIFSQRLSEVCETKIQEISTRFQLTWTGLGPWSATQCVTLKKSLDWSGSEFSCLSYINDIDKGLGEIDKGQDVFLGEDTACKHPGEKGEHAS